MGHFPFGTVSISTGAVSSLVNSTAHVEGSGSQVTSHTGILPSGVQENDFLVASIHMGDNVDNGPSLDDPGPSGFTFVAEQNHTLGVSGNGNKHHSIWYKIATDSEPSTYTWTWSAPHFATICILAFRDVSTSDPLEDFGTTATRLNLTLDSRTTTLPKSLGVYGFTVRSVDLNQSCIDSSPSGFTFVETARDASPPGGEGQYRYGIGFEIYDDVGATGTRSFVFNGPPSTCNKAVQGLQRCSAVNTVFNPV